MNRVFGAILALALLVTSPALAQSQFFPPTGGGGANVNLSNAYELCGFSAVGAKTGVTTGGANAKTAGSGTVICAATANAWSGFRLVLGPASTSTSRYICDISKDGGSTWTFVPNIYVEPNSSISGTAFDIPLAVASGVAISARCQSNTASATLQVGIIGTVTNASSAPMFSTMTALGTPDTTNTRGAVSFTTRGTGSTTYDTITASLAATYGAFLVVPATSSTSPTQGAEATQFTLATGVAGSETVVGYESWWFANATTSGFNRAAPVTIFKSVASGLRLAGQFLVNAAGDTYQAAVYAFN